MQNNGFEHLGNIDQKIVNEVATEIRRVVGKIVESGVHPSLAGIGVAAGLSLVERDGHGGLVAVQTARGLLTRGRVAP